jgi:hypothetical protein
VHNASLRTETLGDMHMQFLGHCWFASLSTEALRELKRDGTVQAWGQKTLRAIKLKIN